MELLLDAMCNVFGAVLFMAILVGGVSVVSNLMPQSGVDPAQLEQQKQTVKTRRSELELLQQRCAFIESMPRLEDDELKKLPPETDVRKLVICINDLTAELNALQQKLVRQQQRSKYLKSIMADRRSAEKLSEKHAQLQQLCEQTQAAVWDFTSLRQTGELEPWRVLLTSKEIFIIGANKHIHQRSAVGRGVDITVFRDGEADYFYLTGQPGKGIALQDFTLQKLALPSEEQHKYFIEILTGADCTDRASQLIKALRKHDLAYHWRTVPANGATLRSSNRRKYEVAR